ncbi:hypothetical protein HPE56_05725 [Maribacter sp. ANRC-HE7]|jgi:hypothetical protein|uniref:Uncharacterized protein n=1 Tax=Maribacter aquimaris TaxID=2737171 RepID=A0ABR7V298_9FLAO|nr:hypothetical protein [Maribacter aquimaris]MBD0777287.1 hypothetical protein [Maribacter aquimaris]
MEVKRKLLLMMITIFVLGCSKENDASASFLSVELLTKDEPAFFDKTVNLFEDNDYLIKTNFDTYIDSYPFKIQHGAGEGPIPLGNYGEIAIQITLDSNNQDLLFMKDYLDRPKDSTYILAHHLEKGSCLIFDKKEKRILSKIEMEKYTLGEPIINSGGRRFYLKSVLFLETVDFIF